MIVYGGFLYIVGSTTGNVMRGKEIITDALIGLFLAIGSYALLKTVNPQAATLQPVPIQFVKREEIPSISQDSFKATIAKASGEFKSAMG